MAEVNATLLDSVFYLVSDVKQYSFDTYTLVKTYLNKSIQSAQDNINNLAVKLQEATVKTISNATNLLSNMINGVQDTVNSISSMVANVRDIVSNLAEDIISSVDSLIESAVDKIREKVNQVIDQVKTVVESVKYEVQQVGNNLSIALDETKNFLGETITSGIKSVNDGVNGLRTLTEDGFNQATNLAKTLYLNTVNVVYQASDNIIKDAKNLFDKTISFIDSSVTSLAQGFTDLFENFQTFFANLFKEFELKLEAMFTVDEEAMYARMAQLAQKYVRIQQANISKG